MKAAVIASPRRFELVEVPLPEPGAGQVRIKLEGCGVCGSNLPPWEGRAWFRYPFGPGSPGHEGWGVVDAVGPNVRIARGTRVAAVSSAAYAEYDLANEEAVVPLPELGSAPFPGEPIGCAVNVLRRADVQPGQTVAVVGVGFLGGLLVRLAKNRGARVIAISRRPFARQKALEMGAEEALSSDEQDWVVRRVSEMTRGRLCERVIEAVGLQGPLDLASALTGERGKLIIAGYHQDGRRQVDLQLWNWRGIDVINAHERSPRTYAEGIRLGAEAVARGELDPAPLLTHSFPLDRIDDAFRAMRDRPEGFLKAWVVT